MNNEKRTIAIVCGGDSSEYEVSLRSAKGLYDAFDHERYEVYVVVMHGLDWHVNLPDGDTATIDRNDFSFEHNGTAIRFDYAYITIHFASPIPLARCLWRRSPSTNMCSTTTSRAMA